MQSELMALFGFDEEDLAANKNGVLSPKQRALFQRDNLGFYISLVVMSIAALAGAVALIPIAQNPETLTPNMVWSGIAALVLLSIWLIVTLLTGIRKRYSFEKVRGAARLEKVLILRGETEAADIWSHEFIVNRVTFHIGGSAFQLLREGDVYLIYYARHLKHILSIDHIPSSS
jgi:hypothetical protein